MEPWPLAAPGLASPGEGIEWTLGVGELMHTAGPGWERSRPGPSRIRRWRAARRRGGTARLSTPPRCGSRRWPVAYPCLGRRSPTTNTGKHPWPVACEAAARGMVPLIRTAGSPAARLNIPPYQARQPAAIATSRTLRYARLQITEAIRQNPTITAGTCAAPGKGELHSVRRSLIAVAFRCA